jgi:hypothetical protein
MTHKISLPILFFTLAGSLFFLGACSDDHDHHHSVIGVVLTIDGDMVAAQEAGTVTYATGDAIDVPAGGSTGTITVRFLDDEGHSLHPESNEYSLGYTVGNTNVLSVTTPVDNDRWSLQLNGLESGSTTLQLDLMHGGHSDFTSVAFQVDVEDQSGN